MKAEQDKIISQLLKEDGLESAPTGYTERVMSQVVAYGPHGSISTTKKILLVLAGITAIAALAIGIYWLWNTGLVDLFLQKLGTWLSFIPFEFSPVLLLIPLAYFIIARAIVLVLLVRNRTLRISF
ncbi:MAG: hypothetical protein R3345_12200 [Fulvivirga sp.]|nr:hypothetical protein [Fulvivirga sp.]